jgi:hypothetical protein
VRAIRVADLEGLQMKLFVQRLLLGDTDFHFVKNRTEALLWRHSEPSQAPAYMVVVFD